MTTTSRPKAVILLERRPRWAAVVTRRADFSVGQARSLDDAWAQLRSSPGALLGVDVDAFPLPNLARFIDRVGKHQGTPATLLLGRIRDPAWARLCREAGAQFVIPSLRQVDDLVRIVDRQRSIAGC